MIRLILLLTGWKVIPDWGGIGKPLASPFFSFRGHMDAKRALYDSLVIGILSLLPAPQTTPPLQLLLFSHGMPFQK